MLLYDSLTRSKKEFVPIKKGHVGMYACGPTVYNYAHIGNLKAYINEDLLKRVLIHDGYEVKHVMNITDVGHLIGDMDYGEDKVKSAAEKENKTPRQIADLYSKIFIRDIKKLNIIMPDVVTNATDNIKEMLELLDRLERKGYLYILDNGVYFDTSKFKDYGKLSGMDFNALNGSIKAGVRVKRPKGLKHVTDFAVWRFSDPEEKEMVWDSKFGRGFPGWHIECSAISMRNLGNHFDIHCGGIDHLSIHHPNEIAQSEAATGETFVNYWVHIGFMKVDGRKMAKALGNGFTLNDIVNKGYSVLAFRYLVLSSHYRSELNFTFEALGNAENTLDRIYGLLSSLNEVEKSGEVEKDFEWAVLDLKKTFYEELNDDLGTPEAFSALHELVKIANIRISDNSINKKEAGLVSKILFGMDKEILGLDFRKAAAKKMTIPAEAEELIKKRESLRARREFDDADKIRKLLREKYKIELVDTKDGSKIKK